MFAAVVAGLAWVLAPVLAHAAPQWKSPAAVAASADGKTVYVSEATSERVAFLDPAAGKVTKELDLPGAPNSIALAADGKRLFVTCDGPEGAICVVDTASPQGHLDIQGRPHTDVAGLIPRRQDALCSQPIQQLRLRARCGQRQRNGVWAWCRSRWP